MARVNAANIEVNPRVKLVASLKAHVTRMKLDAEVEIASINAQAPRLKARAIDAGYNTDLLRESPENVAGNAQWVAMLVTLDKSIRATERMILRAERMARGG